MQIKHAKTNNITDWTQAQLNTIIAGGAAPLPPAGTVLNDVTLPSDWNASHAITGTASTLAGYDGSGASQDVTVGSGLQLIAGTLSSTSSGSGTVTSVSVATANGFAGTVANATSTPAITIKTGVTGLLKGDGTGVSAATSGTDYSTGTSGLATGILKSTTTTGALTIAGAGDFPTLNQNTTGSAATLTTPRAINGVNFDGSAAITVAAAAGTLTGSTLAAGVTASSLTSVGTQAQALNMNSHLINNVTDPSAAQDAATKNYVDLAVGNLVDKADCQAGTTTTLAAYTYNNGSSGVGATITLTVAAVLVLDGYTPVLNDRLLIKNETGGNRPYNGIYKLTTVGVALGAQAVLTRTTDFDQSEDGLDGAHVFVQNGTVNANTEWYCSTNTAITFGTTNISFSQFTGTTYTADNTTLTLTGTTFSLKTSNANGWTGQQYFAEATLTDAATISWNLNTQQSATVTLGGNRTLANPTNMQAGGKYVVRVVQDGTGSRTLAYGNAYKWPGGTAPVLSTGAAAVDILAFYSDGTHMLGVSNLNFS